MGFLATVPGSENKTRTTTELYHRIQRADYYSKWGFMRVVVCGFARYESGLKMKLSENYYRSRVNETLAAAQERFLELGDLGEMLMSKSLPLEAPYDEPEAVFSRSYNVIIPKDIDIQDNSALYGYLYEKIKTDSIYSDIEDLLEDPTLEEIKAY